MAKSRPTLAGRAAPKTRPTPSRAARVAARRRADRISALQWWGAIGLALVVLALFALGLSTFSNGSGVVLRGHG